MKFTINPIDYKILAGDYVFYFYVNAVELEHFQTGLQLAEYTIQIYKKGKYVNPKKTDIYNDLGITRDEFLELVEHATRQMIADVLSIILDRNPATPIRSFIFFASDESNDVYRNRYGLSQHEIFERISDGYRLVHSYDSDGGKIYVHTCEIVSKSGFEPNGNIFAFDFYADYEIIEQIRDKIEANRFTDLDEN